MNPFAFWGNKLLLMAAIEIPINAFLIFAVLNLMAPPIRLTPISDHDEYLLPSENRTRGRWIFTFPLWRCFLASALLFAAGILTISLVNPFLILVSLPLWYFLSVAIIKRVLRARVSYRMIFLIYVLISFAVEWLINHTVRV